MRVRGDEDVSDTLVKAAAHFAVQAWRTTSDLDHISLDPVAATACSLPTALHGSMAKEAGTPRS
jgi:hypothetical protein